VSKRNRNKKNIQDVPRSVNKTTVELPFHPFDKISIFCFWAIFVSVFMVYLRTLCPTLYAGDSGEFITVVHTMGIAHPPGHPTYILVGKLFDLLPFGNPAFRLNLMSAFFGALSCSFLYMAVRLMIGKTKYRDAIAMISALMFAFSRSSWNFSLFAETYSLNTFFVSVLIFMCFCMKESGDRGFYAYSKWFFLLLGIGLGDHPTLLLWSPAFVLFFILFRARTVLNVRFMLNAFVWGLVGVSVYLYVYIRGVYFKPQFDISQVTSFGKFVYTLMAKQYMNIPLAPQSLDLMVVLKRIMMIAGWLVAEAPWSVWGVVILSVLLAFRRYMRSLLPFVLSVSLIYFAGVYSPIARFSLDRESYFISAVLVLAMWVGAGLSIIGELLGKISSVTVRRIVVSAVALILCYCVCENFYVNYKINDKSRDYLAYDMGKAILDTMEPGAVLFAQKDWVSFSLVYLNVVEGMRPDVKIYNRTATLFPNLPGYKETATRNVFEAMAVSYRLEDQFIMDNPGANIYFDDKRPMQSISGRFKSISKGILYKIVPVDYMEKDGIRIFETYKIRGLDRPLNEWWIGESKILIDYYVHLAEVYFDAGDAENGLRNLDKARYCAREFFSEKQQVMIAYTERGYYQKAIEILNDQLVLLPSYAMTYKKLGIMYMQYLNDRQVALRNFRKYLEIYPEANDRQQVQDIIDKLSKGQ